MGRRTLSGLALLALAAFGAVGAGCPRKPPPPACGADVPRVVEVRDGAGTLLRFVTRAPEGARLVCEGDRPRLRLAGERALLPSGMERFHLAADGAIEPSGATLLRLYASPTERRVLDAAGVPRGSIGGDAAHATISDPAGRGVLVATSAEGRVAVTLPDGTARFLVTGLPDARRAALVAVPGVALDDALALALLWSPGPGDAIDPNPLSVSHQKDAAP